MKRTGSGEKTSRSSGSSTSRTRRLPDLWSEANFALCVNTGNNVDLDLRKLYRLRTDRKAMAPGFVRIVDESGEDYLYPASFFLPVSLPARAARIFRQLA